MIDKLRVLYNKHGDILRYLIIGGLTTVIDILVFALCNSIIGLSYTVSKIISWAFAVVFAFVGNKKIVFQAAGWDRESLLREGGSFLIMRLITLGISLGLLYLMIDLGGWSENFSNILANIVVIILNYVFSKLIIFRKKA